MSSFRGTTPGGVGGGAGGGAGGAYPGGSRERRPGWDEPASRTPGAGPGGEPPPRVEAPPGERVLRAESRPAGDEELHILPGPGMTDEEEAVRERMNAESPDGRPPPLRERREARRLFLAGLVIVAVVVLVAVYIWGGPGALAVALVLWGIFIGLAAWPTWHAAADRKIEEKRARREVRAERHKGAGVRERDRGVSGG